MNAQLVRFAFEGAAECDSTPCTRTPNNLRTILGSNVDSELIASAVSHNFFEPTLEVTPPSQRAFCRGRQLCSNIVDLDV